MGISSLAKENRPSLMAKGVSLEEVLPFLPPNLRKMIATLAPTIGVSLEELRLRLGAPVALRFAYGEAFLGKDGRLTNYVADGYLFSPQEMEQAVLLLSNSSFYALEEELRRGYITLPGGHRAGLTGRAVLEKGYLRTLKNISGINIRIARYIPGAADGILPYLFSPTSQKLLDTLVISPPRAGKTTVLRDLARQLSEGMGACRRSYNVSIVDERSEIAAVVNGMPQIPVGCRSDILDACPKAEGMMMLIRSMSPEIIICDEIGREEDVLAIHEAINAGIVVIASAHGEDCEDALARPFLGKLIQDKYFKRLVILSRLQGPGTVKAILDSEMQEL